MDEVSEELLHSDEIQKQRLKNWCDKKLKEGTGSVTLLCYFMNVKHQPGNHWGWGMDFNRTESSSQNAVCPDSKRAFNILQIDLVSEEFRRPYPEPSWGIMLFLFVIATLLSYVLIYWVLLKPQSLFSILLRPDLILCFCKVTGVA